MSNQADEAVNCIEAERGTLCTVPHGCALSIGLALINRQAEGCLAPQPHLIAGNSVVHVQLWAEESEHDTCYNSLSGRVAKILPFCGESH
jgi:hypothetical protein